MEQTRSRRVPRISSYAAGPGLGDGLKAVYDALFASQLKAHQEELEREKQPVPPKPQKALRVPKSGRLDTLKPSRDFRPR
jgi:hypothetical protein